MSRTYETQDIRAATTTSAPAFIWRCHRCGRYLGTIERVDGTLEIRHHCGAVNQLRGHLWPALDTGAPTDVE